MIGNWLNYDTSVTEVTAFAEKVYLKHDLSGFDGDPDFIADTRAQKAFSKLRSSIGGVYNWRITNAKTPDASSARPTLSVRRAPKHCSVTSTC